MDKETLQAVVDEILPILERKRIGKIFQLARHALAVDFRPGDGRYLFLNFEPSATPRIYLVRRRVKELEKQSQNTGNFVLFARSRLAGAQLARMTKDADDRIVRFLFLTETEGGEIEKFTLVAQLTGRAANFFLLDANNVILDSLRDSHGVGQEAGQSYAPPQAVASFGDAAEKKTLLDIVSTIEIPPAEFPLAPPSPLSEKLDAYFLKIESERDFESQARAATNRLRQELVKKEKLAARLRQDLSAHGDAESLKKQGDLLLANLHAARREGETVFVVDYFDENAPEIAVKIDEHESLTEAAERFFARYAKARNAAAELTGRIEKLETEISDLKIESEKLEKTIAARDETALSGFLEKFGVAKQQRKTDEGRKSKKEPEVPSGVRRYRSSNGLEILVGRAARDNDFLTFRVAKSLDWWLHAADYPGSHVVVRNPSRGELPPRTLLEAAQLAAKFSQARADAKVAVNYAQRKFVSKPKNAAPGLVRLASFKTILVEPKESGERI